MLEDAGRGLKQTHTLVTGSPPLEDNHLHRKDHLYLVEMSGAEASQLCKTAVTHGGQAMDELWISTLLKPAATFDTGHSLWTAFFAPCPGSRQSFHLRKSVSFYVATRFALAQVGRCSLQNRLIWGMMAVPAVGSRFIFRRCRLIAAH
jgi:hypothetical protein